MTDAAVPQRVVLVLPSTGEFDSRTYRIASTLQARGHAVTVLARHRAGLARIERHPAGYDIVRVEVRAIDGLPFPGLVRAIRDRLRRRDARAMTTGTTGPETSDLAGVAGQAGATSIAPASLPRRIGAGIVRRLAIQLTIRAQMRASRSIAPAADVYHGMAYMGIPIALDLARRNRARAIYDARDIYLDAGNLARLPRPIRWVIARSERGWARRADRVLTVNRPYAQVMARRWGIDVPAIVLNCPYRTTPADPRERRFHDRFELAAGERIVLYQGGFSRDRGIEQLIDAIRAVPAATLVLLGYGILRDELQARAADPVSEDRVRIMDAVPPTELLDWVASADVVAMPIQPTTLNHRLTTPNKLFEAMAAGVPVVASDLPGMADIVRETGCGILVDPTDPDALAAALRGVLDRPTEELAAWRRRCSKAARETYAWELQADVLLAEYGRLTGRPW